MDVSGVPAIPSELQLQLRQFEEAQPDRNTHLPESPYSSKVRWRMTVQLKSNGCFSSDTISAAEIPRKETLLLSLMHALQVNSGTSNKNCLD